MRECVLYKKREDGGVECTACSHRCLIADGKKGICGVRENQSGKLLLLVYGKVVSMNADPIEKKPIFHMLPGTKSFSIGTVGCNFRCDFCQNWEISQKPKHGGAVGIDLTPEQVVKKADEEGCDSIAYTYNEPAIFVEFAHDTAKLAKKAGLRNVYVSNGYETEEALDFMGPYLDAINVDLKSFSDDFYVKYCGGRLAPVLDTIKRAKEKRIWVEVTTLVIPGKNDSDNELKKIAEFIASVDKEIPWHISRFYPMYKMQDVESTDMKTLLRAHGAGMKAGLRYVYIGNILDESYEVTKCPECGEVLIDRAWHAGKITNNLVDSKCVKCKAEIKGVWS